MKQTKKKPTMSQTMRAAIYRVWEFSLERKNGMVSEEYYEKVMSQMIRNILNTLEPPIQE